MKTINRLKMQFDAKSANESFARATVGAFIAQLDPTIDEISDIKTAVSEAVTNCIVHAYKELKGDIYITVKISDNNKTIIKIRDKGCGIADIEKAKEPLFTTGGSERAGLGFAVMESFSDKMTVKSKLGKGTCVTLYKQIKSK